MNSGWLKERWLEIRWGAVYLNFPVTVITFIIVSYNDIILASRFHPYFPTFEDYLVPSLVGALVALQIIGFLHGRWQQETDVMKSNKALLEAVRLIVREELAAKGGRALEQVDETRSAAPHP